LFLSDDCAWRALRAAAMGNETSRKPIKCLHNQPSPSGSGLKSVVSEPLDDRTDVLSFWYSLMTSYRNPQGKTKLVEHSPSEIQHVMILRGEELMGVYGIESGRPADEEIELRELHMVDKRSRCIRTMSMFKDKLVSRKQAQVYEKPLRLEVWHEKPGKRHNGQVNAMVDFLIKAILKRTQGGTASKIEIETDVPSIFWPGSKSILSGPLDDHLDFERLWQETVDMIKYYTEELPGLRESVVTAPEGEAGDDFDTFTITHLVDRSETIQPQGTSSDKDEVEWNVRNVFLFKSKRLIEVEDWGKKQAPLGAPSRLFIGFLRDPLRIEAWGEQSGLRETRAGAAVFWQGVINQCLNRQCAQAEQAAKEENPD